MSNFVIIVCGVSGCGKSTIGRALADSTGWPFVEGDDFHPERNIRKMSSGQALTDQDRQAWLLDIVAHLDRYETEPSILACSALTPYVQEFLRENLRDRIVWIKLAISREDALRRMSSRDHFMPATLMESQFEAWTPPQSGASFSTKNAVNVIVDDILSYLKNEEIIQDN